MRSLLAITLCLVCSASSRAPAQVHYKIVGPGCGPTVAVPWDVNGVLTFKANDPNAFIWGCNRGKGNGWVGRFVIVLSVPSAALTPLPSQFTPCLLRGSSLVILPAVEVSPTATEIVLGTVPKGLDVYIQGVFLLNTTGAGRSCPFYLSVTPTWRVWK